MAPANESHHKVCRVGSQVCTTPCDVCACLGWELFPFFNIISIDMHVQVLAEMEYNMWARTQKNTVSSRRTQHEPLAKLVIVFMHVFRCMRSPPANTQTWTHTSMHVIRNAEIMFSKCYSETVYCIFQKIHKNTEDHARALVGCKQEWLHGCMEWHFTAIGIF